MKSDPHVVDLAKLMMVAIEIKRSCDGHVRDGSVVPESTLQHWSDMIDRAVPEAVKEKG